MRLIEKIWFENHPVTKFLAPLLWPLSQLFNLIARARRIYFSRESRAYRAPIAVIIVGNISVGGNGKTPLVIWLVEQLKAQGWTPGVISRGYGSKAQHYPLLIDEHTHCEQGGDEPVLIYQRTGVPVAIAACRSQAVQALLPLGVNIIVGDDGLQHYRLARDLEFAVIDAKRRFGNGHTLPLGPLREKPTRLAQVDFVISNGEPAADNERQMSLIPRQFVNLKTKECVLAEHFNDAIAIAGIGSPARFFAGLASLGVSLKQTIAFADHCTFSFAQLSALTPNGEPLIMTEKDAVKCRFLLEQKADINNWWYLPVDASFSDKDTHLILSAINQLKEKYGSQIA